MVNARREVKATPLLKIKRKIPSVDREALIAGLNKVGPIQLAKDWYVSKVTLFKAIHYYGIKRVSKYD